MNILTNSVGIVSGLNGIAFNGNGAPIVPVMEATHVGEGEVMYCGGVLHEPMGNSLDGFARFVPSSRVSYNFIGSQTMLRSRWGKGVLTQGKDSFKFSCPVLGNPERVFEVRLQVAKRGESAHYDTSSHLSYFSGEDIFAVTQYAAIDATFPGEGYMFRASQPPCGISTIVVLGGEELLRRVVTDSVHDKDGVVNPQNVLRLASMFARDEDMTLSIYDGAGNLQATSEVNLQGSDSRIPAHITAALLDLPHDKKVKVSRKVVQTSYDGVTPVDDYPGYGVVYLPDGVKLLGVDGVRQRQLSGPLVGAWQTLTFREGGTEPFSSPVVDMVLAAADIWPEVFPLRR